MHPDTTGGSKIRRGLAGALSRVLAVYMSKPPHTPGQRHLWQHQPLRFLLEWLGSGPQEQHRIETIIGAAVFQTYKALRPVHPGPLRVLTQRGWNLVYQNFTSEEVAAAQEMLAQTRTIVGELHEIVELTGSSMWRRDKASPTPSSAEHLRWDGEVAWVSLPGEVFVELGNGHQETLAFPTDLCCRVGQTKTSVTFPTAESYAQGKNY